MIAKIIKSKSDSKSGMARSVRYVIGAQGGVDPLTWQRTADYVLDIGEPKEGERVASWRIMNCEHHDDLALATAEILNTQAQNTRAQSERHMHLVVSFPAGENPAAETIHAIEDDLVDALGLSEHQRISAVHIDTDHLHTHIVINKIHPQTYKIASPAWAKRTLMRACHELEIKYGLERTNHGLENEKEQAVSRELSDIEAKSGQLSLESWAREKVAEPVIALIGEEGKNWEDVHLLLAAHGLEIKRRGAGLVISSEGGVTIKASAVDRGLSMGKLEAALGEYQAPSDNVRAVVPGERYCRQPALGRGASVLWTEFQAGRKNTWQTRSEGFISYQEGKDALYRQFDKRFEILKASPFRGLRRRRLFAELYAQRKVALAKLRGDLQHELANRPILTWQAFLIELAGAGREDAIKSLSAYRDKVDCYSRQITAAESGNFQQVVIDGLKAGKESKRGITRHYAPDGGVVAASKDGLSIAMPSLQAEAGMIALAAERYSGQLLQVNGDKDFQRRVAELAGEKMLNIRFKDNSLERSRKLSGRSAQRRQVRERERGEGREM